MNDKDLKRIEAHLKRTFGTDALALKAGGRSEGVQVYVGKDRVGVLHEDEDEDGSYNFEAPVAAADMKGAEAHLKRIFGAAALALKPRPKQKDSCEVYVGEEFVGVVYQDEDEDGSFLFEMAILAEDLA